MSTKGHVWTAPWQELFDVAAALVGCGHVSGLFVRHNGRWPYCFERIGSQSLARTLKCDDPHGFSRSPKRPGLHYVVLPSPIPSLRQQLFHLLELLLLQGNHYSTPDAAEWRSPPHHFRRWCGQQNVRPCPLVPTAALTPETPLRLR